MNDWLLLCVDVVDGFLSCCAVYFVGCAIVVLFFRMCLWEVVPLLGHSSIVIHFLDCIFSVAF